MIRCLRGSGLHCHIQAGSDAAAAMQENVQAENEKAGAVLADGGNTDDNKTEKENIPDAAETQESDNGQSQTMQQEPAETNAAGLPPETAPS